MTTIQLLPQSFTLSHPNFSRPLLPFAGGSGTLSLKPHVSRNLTRVLKQRSSLNIDGDGNGFVESKKLNRRGRKKGPTSSSSSSTTKTTKRSRKTQVENGPTVTKPTNESTEDAENLELELEDFDDELDFPYEDPPLICCFGAVQKEFVPTVRVHDNPMHPDIYSQWKMLQWDPPEFVRAPGGPPSNVAISHVRLGGRAAFMGKVGKDDLGDELVLMMNKERVQTRAVKFDSISKTACAKVKIKLENGKMCAEIMKESAEDSLRSSELNLSVLKEVTLV